MDRPRLICCLRIVVSAGFGVLCALLIVLWVRSDSLADICGVTFAAEKRTNFASEKGRVFLIIFDYETSLWTLGKSREWDIRSEPISSVYPDARTEEELIQQMGIPNFPGFEFSAPGGYYRVVVPHWFLILLSATFAAIPWLPWSKRFSVRTLLMATTLIAILLGLAAWASR